MRKAERKIQDFKLVEDFMIVEDFKIEEDLEVLDHFHMNLLLIRQ